jgi:hypothetical protein
MAPPLPDGAEQEENKHFVMFILTAPAMKIAPPP